MTNPKANHKNHTKWALLPFFNTLRVLASKKSLIWTAALLGFGIIVANLLSLIFPLALLQIYDRVIPNHSTSTLIVLVLIVISAVVCESILRISIAQINQWLDSKFEYQYGIENIRRITDLSIKNFKQRGIGFYIEKLEEIEKLKNFYAANALSSIFNIPFIIIFLGLVGHIGGALVATPIIITTLIAATLYYLTPIINKNHKQKNEINTKLSNYIINTLENMHYIKAQAIEAQMLRRYERLYESKLALNLTEWKTHILQLIRSLGGQIIMLAVAVTGAPMVINNQLSIGGLAACIILSSRCVQPLNTAAQVWIRLQTVNRAKETIETALNNQQQEAAQKTIPKPPINILFDDVAVISEKNTILQNLRLEVPFGSCIAIEGGNTILKSMLFKLLLNETNPSSGKVVLNNTQVNKIKPSAIASCFSYISKDYAIYNDTIINNLTEFDERRTALAIHISEALGLIKYIQRLPDGFDTVLNSRKILQMPVGIKQLINITRGLTKPSDIILFDEANAFLSIPADRLLIKYLDKIKHKKTLIIASQRYSLTSIADKKYKITSKTLNEVPDESTACSI